MGKIETMEKEKTPPFWRLVEIGVKKASSVVLKTAFLYWYV